MIQLPCGLPRYLVSSFSYTAIDKYGIRVVELLSAAKQSYSKASNLVKRPVRRI